MPKYIELIDSKGRMYILLSSYNDVIEKIFPPMWFGAYKFFQLTELCGYSEDEAREIAYKELKKWVRKPCPVFLLALYDTNSKKEQERLLKGKSITFENLICWFLQGGRDKGLFSQYSYDAGVPDEFKGRAPILIDATDENNINAIGKTDLSDAALMHLLKNQTKVIAQFMDYPDGRWYCFYRTHRGLAGRESGNHGHHMHFISSAYGVSRESLIEGFKKGVCPGNGFHVHLTGCWEK